MNRKKSQWLAQASSVAFATLAVTVMAGSAQAQQTAIDVQVPPPPGHTPVYSTWDEGDRIWRDYYWYVPEGGGDIHGYCLSQSFSTYNPEGTPQARGSARTAPNGLCNRNEFGVFTPGRAPWDRENTLSIQADHSASRAVAGPGVSEDSQIGAILDGRTGDDRDGDGNVIGDALNWFFCGLFPGPLCSQGEGGSRAAAFAGETSRMSNSPLSAVLSRHAAEAEDVPAMVGGSTFVNILVQEVGGGSFYCTGTLVNRRQVLTSAVCFEGVSVQSISVLLDDSDPDIYFPAMSVTIHAGYDPITFENNDALITLATSELWTEVDDDTSWLDPDLATWVDGLDPFVERHAVAGDGYWHDASHWELGDIPENDEADGSVVVTDLYVAPELYEVHLDAAGRTIIQQDESADAVYVFSGATLEIEETGSLFLDTGLGLQGGEVLLDGLMIGQTLRLESGRFIVGETGFYYDFSPYFSDGTHQNGAWLEIHGDFLTDWLHQTDGVTYVGENGVYFDWLGSLIEGGELVIDGVYDTGSFMQSGGLTYVGETGLLYDEEGETYIGGGQLLVDGVLDTLALEFAGAMVGGNGLISAPLGVYQIGGVLAPGWSSPGRAPRPDGVLSIDGNFEQFDGQLALISDGQSMSRLHVAGSAHLDGIITVSWGDRPLRGAQFTFLQADGGLLGLDVELIQAELSPVLSLQLGSSSHAAWLDVVAADYAGFAQTDQQRAVGAALDAAMGTSLPSGDLADVAMMLDYLPSSGDLQTALQSLNPSDLYGMDRMSEGLTRSLGDVVSGRLGHFRSGRHGGASSASPAASQLASSRPDAGMLMAALRASTAVHGQTGQDGLNDETAVYVVSEMGRGETELPNGAMDIDQSRIVLGVDHEFAPGWLLGGNVSLSEYTAERTGARVQGEAVSVTGYAGFAKGLWYGSAYAGFSRTDLEFRRTATVGTFSAVALGDTEADQWHGGFDLGAGFDLGGLTAGPVLTLRHGESEIEAYQETGLGSFNASIAARGDDRTVLGTGVRAFMDAQTSLGTWSVDGEVSWQQDVSAGDGPARASLAVAPSQVFDVIGPDADARFVSLSLGVSLQASDRLALGVRLRSDLDRADGDSHAASVAASWRF
jgi:uncharacterized protein YhjY with autotransporter beta-barrel domain